MCDARAIYLNETLLVHHLWLELLSPDLENTPEGQYNRCVYNSHVSYHPLLSDSHLQQSPANHCFVLTDIMVDWKSPIEFARESCKEYLFFFQFVHSFIHTSAFQWRSIGLCIRFWVFICECLNNVYLRLTIVHDQPSPPPEWQNS